MKKLLFVVSISLVYITLLFSAVNSKAQSCSYTDDFESATLGATSFTSGGYTFNIISHVSTFNISDDDASGYGWNGTAADNQLVDNNDANVSNPLPNASFSIKSTSGQFSVKNFWAYPDQDGSESVTGTVTFTGKLAGATVFTVTLNNSYFNTDGSVNGGYTYIDFSTAALGYNTYQTIDELEITVGGNYDYIGIDEFKWVAGGAIPNTATTVATSVAQSSATLNGSVNADNLNTMDTFSYSTSSTLSSGVTKITASSATGSSSTSLSAAITGLSQSTTYYYRVSSTNCGATSLGSILSFTTTADYYSASSGALDVLATWSTNTNGTGGSHPANFTNGSIFHVANSNTGTISGSNWTVSGTGSKVVLDQGTDLSISSTKPVNATIDVSAGRKLTIANSTLPTLGVLSPTSTIDYLNLSSLSALSATATYGNVTLDGTMLSALSAPVNIAGTLTLQNNAAINTVTGSVSVISLVNGGAISLANSSVINITGTDFTPVTALVNNGTISGAGQVALVGNDNQTISGTGTISNLQINAVGLTTNTVTFASGSNMTSITGTLTITNGIVATNGNLTLISSASGTARIAPITALGGFVGIVHVQQYIPGGRRTFRFLGHPFNAAIPLSQLTANIAITGTGGSTNGFTPTITNNPSAFWFNTANGDNITQGQGTNAGWTAFTNTTATSGNNAWNQYEGIRVLVRGTPGQGLDGNSYTPGAVTLNMSGSINTDLITEPLAVGSVSGYNLLSNPYPSPTDIGTVIHNAASHISGSAYWVWDETQASQGAYMPQLVSSSGNAVPYYLPANASFIVDAATTGNLTFDETNKGATASASLFRVTGMDNGVTLHLYDSNMHSWDIAYISFSSNASDSIENNDARKLHNPDLDFYTLSADKQMLCIDARPYVAGQVIPLGVATDVQQAYIIKAEDFTLPAGEEVYLHDKYLNQYQEIQSGSQYKFTVTADAASQGDNRFELGMAETATGIANVNSSNLKVDMVPNPATEQVTITYEAPKSEHTTVRIMTMTGQSVVTMDLGNEQSGNVIIPLHSVVAGIYLLELTSGTQTVTQRLVKQ